MNVSDPIISARDVRKSFEGDSVLADISLELYENETTLLMGPNGAGKTIFLSCITNALQPTNGDITVFGKSPKKARSQMSFLLQGGVGLPSLSGKENIEFYDGLHPRTTDDWQDIAETMGMTEHLDRPVRDYSGGMLRKLELAITFMVDVPLYMLDEPTAELDLTTIKQLHSLIEEKKADGDTIVLTSHNPVNVEIADRIVFIQYGEVVTEGEPEELMEAVPSVVRVLGTTDFDELTDYVLDGQFFESGQEQRGFLKEDADLGTETGDGTVQMPKNVKVEEPGYADLFNYYTRIVPSKN